MCETRKTRKSLSTALLAVMLLLALSILGWREWDHRKETAHQEGIEAQLRATHLQVEADVLEYRTLAETRKATIEDQRVALQSLEDRCENLQAQRDHLKAESDRLAGHVHAMRSTIGDLESQLEENRTELLAAQAQPRELAGLLQASKARNAALEARLDQHAEHSQTTPAAFEVAGLSSDKTVFSLSGDFSEDTELPTPVHICGTDGIYLDGWIHRREEAFLIGHVKRWQRGTSTLVKGQKVFILPRKRYEAVPN
ncbi:MAG: hypothetical protein AB3N33_10290 [Puniceicoccaceae bacterium]